MSVLLRRRRWFALVAMVGVVLCWMTATSTAQSFQVLHSFGGPGDGFNPEWAGVNFDTRGNLYGTTFDGGTGPCDLTFGCGTVYEMMPNSNGTWTETVIHNFGLSDVASPLLGVAFDHHGNLYSTGESNGQTYTFGGVVELEPSRNGSWNERVLYDFDDADGADPAGIVADNFGNLFVSVTNGGIFNAGLIFGLIAVSFDGHYPSDTYSFHGGLDGSGVYGALILDRAGNLYGTTAGGGYGKAGTVFKLTRSSPQWDKTILHTFQGSDDGAYPWLGLAFDGAGNLYGTTLYGGSANFGTVYRLTPTPDGNWNENVIYAFQGGTDGQWPYGSVAVDGAGNVYGTTSFGGLGSSAYGTVFRLTPSGDGQWTKTILHTFSGPDGAFPDAGLTLDSEGNLYGTTNEGGAYQFQNGGVVFEITP